MFSRPLTLSLASQLPPVDLHLVWHHRSKITHRTLEKPPAKALSMLSCGKGLLHIFCRRHLCLYIPRTICLFCNIMMLLTHVQIMLHCNSRSSLPKEHYPPHIWENGNCCLRNEPLYSYWRPAFFFFFQIISPICCSHTKLSSCLPSFIVTPSFVSSANTITNLCIPSFSH